MSEPIPEAIPTSADPRSRRPVKKRALTPVSKHASNIDALFANPNNTHLIPSAPKAKTLAPPPEIVANVQGSSAGAGSGEFHVYKASRRREGERLRMMDEEVEREKKDQEWEERNKREEEKIDKKRSKNQARRQKIKANKDKAKESGPKLSHEGNDLTPKAKLNGLVPKTRNHGSDDEAMKGDDGGDNAPGIVIHDED